MGRLIRQGDFDEALVELYHQAELHPNDATISRAISELRNRITDLCIERLGSGAASVRQVGVLRDNVEPDEDYLLSLVNDKSSLDSVLHASTLGRYRSARLLTSLSRRGIIEIRQQSNVARGAAESQTSDSEVIVAMADATQASLTRTMLRTLLVRQAVFVTAADFAKVRGIIAHRPALLVIDYRLPGAPDALDVMAQIRHEFGGFKPPTVVIAQNIELNYVQSRLPAHARLVKRPPERAALERAIRDIASRLLPP